jgi:hypothetical protein
MCLKNANPHGSLLWSYCKVRIFIESGVAVSLVDGYGRRAMDWVLMDQAMFNK